ncbi:hypothetical protein D3C73_1382160 [compost metagenome]
MSGCLYPEKCTVLPLGPTQKQLAALRPLPIQQGRVLFSLVKIRSLAADHLIRAIAEQGLH